MVEDLAGGGGLTTLGSPDDAALGPPRLVEQARAFAQESLSPRTRREYARAWRWFVSWCAGEGLSPLPALPDTGALYLTARATAGKSVATLEQDLAALGCAHRQAGFASPRENPVVRAVRAGIRRRLGVAPRQKAPLLAGQLKSVVGGLPGSLLGVRDRALLLLGFAGAFRRAELVALQVSDLEWTEEGLKVRLRRSKTDQEGEGGPWGSPADRARPPVRWPRCRPGWAPRGSSRGPSSGRSRGTAGWGSWRCPPGRWPGW